MRQSCVLIVLSIATLVVASACGGATASPAQAVGATTVTLGDGKMAALPKGTLYVQFLDVPQPAGNNLTHAHIAGFVYLVNGAHRLVVAGGETKDLKVGEGAFVPADISHTHTNPGTTESRWYFISIRPNTARTAAPTFPGQKELFGTPDLPAMADGAYTQALRMVTLQPNGRTAAHKHGGLESLVLLEGSVEVRVQGASPKMLATGQGTHVAAGTPLQIRNTGNSAAKFLAYFVTAEGQAFSTDVDTAP
jgi:quercetin dioxygenase-like cupin family protein